MKIIGYIRVSTKNQDLQRQETKINDYCKLKNYEIVKLIPDDGISGATNERSGYKELLSLKAEDADMIIVSELSRLSRKEDIMSTLNDIHSIVSKGFKLLFLDQPEKIYEGTLDLTEILILSLTAYGAAQERSSIKKRNQEGKEVLFRLHPYAVVDGLIPYGFIKAPNPAQKHPKYLLQEVKEEIDILKKIYDLILEGKSLSKIVDYLYHSGIRHSGDSIFTKQHLSKLIQNPIYKGERTRKETISHIKPIIDPEKWNLVQVKLTENKYYNSSGITMFNPLKGILKCRCGRAMVVKRKFGDVNVYRCSQILPAYMPNKCEYLDSIRYDFTNVTILAFLKELDFVKYEGQGAEKIIEIRNVCNSIENDAQNDRLEVKKLEEKIQKLFERYAGAEDSDLANYVKQQINETRKEKLEIEKNIAKKEKKILQYKDQIRSLEIISKEEQFNNLDLTVQADIFRKYIDKIQYFAVTTMQGFYKIDLKIGVTEYIAIRKTDRNPLIIRVPDIYTINENLTLSYDYYVPSKNGDPLDFNTLERKTITIQEYFKSYEIADRLEADFSYRKTMTKSIRKR